jgi:hypothetical protein
MIYDHLLHHVFKAKKAARKTLFWQSENGEDWDEGNVEGIA